MLPTWMPGRNPFAAEYVYLRNHPGISPDFSELYFAKLYLGWVGDLAGVFKDKELKARG